MRACGDEYETMFCGVEEGGEFASCRCTCRSSSYDYHVLSFIGGRHRGREKVFKRVGFGVFRLATGPAHALFLIRVQENEYLM